MKPGADHKTFPLDLCLRVWRGLCKGIAIGIWLTVLLKGR